MIGLAAAAAAAPQAAERSGIPHVVEVVGHGVRIDWTTLRMEVSASAQGPGQSVDAAEQLARREAEAGFQQAVGSVRVTGDARVADLMADSELGSAIRSRIPRWEVDEASYHTAGGVDLLTSLSLQELLRPWALQIARPATDRVPSPPGRPTHPTGILVDARGTGLRPSYVVRLVTEEGLVLYGGELSEEQAVAVPPFRFLADPADPSAAQAGARPMILIASDSRDGDIVLGASSLERIVAAGEGLFGHETVLVVVDAR